MKMRVSSENMSSRPGGILEDEKWRCRTGDDGVHRKRSSGWKNILKRKESRESFNCTTSGTSGRSRKPPLRPGLAEIHDSIKYTSTAVRGSEKIKQRKPRGYPPETETNAPAPLRKNSRSVLSGPRTKSRKNDLLHEINRRPHKLQSESGDALPWSSKQTPEPTTARRARKTSTKYEEQEHSFKRQVKLTH